MLTIPTRPPDRGLLSTEPKCYTRNLLLSTQHVPHTVSQDLSLFLASVVADSSNCDRRWTNGKTGKSRTLTDLAPAGFVCVAAPTKRDLRLLHVFCWNVSLLVIYKCERRSKRSVNWLNPLMGTGNYSATSNNMKLVHWPLMDGLGCYIWYSE